MLPIDPVTSFFIKTIGEEIKKSIIERIRTFVRLGAPQKSTEMTLLEKIDGKIKQLSDHLTENRISTLYAGLNTLKDYAFIMSVPQKNQYPFDLSGAMNNFQFIVSLPTDGYTGKFSNSELRSIAFLGLAAIYYENGYDEDLVLEKIYQAAISHRPLMIEMFGIELVTSLLGSGEPLPRSFQVSVDPKCYHMAFSPDSSYFAFGVEESNRYGNKIGELWFVDFIRRKVSLIPQDEKHLEWGWGGPLSFSPDQNFLVSVSGKPNFSGGKINSLIGMWNIKNESWNTFLVIDCLNPNSLSFSNKGGTLFFSDSFEIRRFDNFLKTEWRISHFSHPAMMIAKYNDYIGLGGNGCLLLDYSGKNKVFEGTVKRIKKRTNINWYKVDACCSFSPNDFMFANVTFVQP